MSSLRRGLVYLGSFGAGRGALFVAPILIANAVPADVYGELEFAQALASVLALVLAAGSAAAVPLALVQRSERYSWPALLLHQALMGAALALLALVLFSTGAPVAGWAACAATTVLMLQAFWSAYLKSVGRPEASLFLESGFWLVSALAVVCSWLVSIPEEGRGQWLWASVSMYCIGLMAWTTWRMIALAGKAVETYWGTVRAAFPLLLTALLAVLVTTSGRLATGALMTPEVTADYAILFRVTAVPIVAHQILMVARFRQLFEVGVQEIERRLLAVVGLVVVSVIACWALLEPTAPLFGDAFVGAMARHPQAGALILAQCVLWSAIAVNDLVNTRVMMAGRVAGWTMAYVAVLLVGSWIALGGGAQMTLDTFVPVHSIMMLGFYVTQSAAMAGSGIRLGTTWGVSVVSFIGLSAGAYFAVQPS